MVIYEIQNPLPVHTPHGSGLALFIYDYSININTVFGVRIDETGEFKHYYSDEILTYSNPMNGEPKIKIPDTWKK